MHTRIVMVGYFEETVELAQECGFNVVGYIDRPGGDAGRKVPWLGDDESLPQLIEKLVETLLLLTPDEPAVRQRLHRLYASWGLSFASLISPMARVSRSATLGHGVCIHWGSHVSTNVLLGDGVRLNTGANVMHDTSVGNFSTIAPNACVLGRVTIGNGCYIGANATLLPGLSIGDCAVVGAGSVVTRDVPAGDIVVGNPARLLRPGSSPGAVFCVEQ